MIQFGLTEADKAQYDAYYERPLYLVRPSGLIAIDNLRWGWMVADAYAQDSDTLAIRALNTKLQQDLRIGYSLLPMAEGLGLAVRF